MDKYRKRPEWRVRLRKSCLPGQAEGAYVPRVLLANTVDLPGLAKWAATLSRGTFDAPTMELAAHYLIRATAEALVEAMAVDTPLGRLTPVVTGLWNPDRVNPAARAQNQAAASFSMGPVLEQALADPLFREDAGGTQGPYVVDVYDQASGTHNERMTPGGLVHLRGRYLLMKGDLPGRGLEIIRADTGEVACTFGPEELAGFWNTRSRLCFVVPASLPPGTYRLAVSTQCTSGPVPLRRVNRRDAGLELRVGGGDDEGEE